MPPTLLFDRSARARFTVGGAAPVPTLNGLVTNDVAALRPGDGCYAAALTAKGRVIADLRILALADGTLWLDTGERAAPGLRAMLAKYVNPRFARVTEISAETGAVLVAGPAARPLVSAVTGADDAALGALALHGHVVGEHGGTPVRVLRVAPLAAEPDEAYEILARLDLVPVIAAALAAGGATRSDAATWDALRVARGAPEWGLDLDETTLAPEANLDERHAVSYTKGCYIGQETVARVHFRGHVNRMLRQLRVESGSLPPRGAALVADAGNPVGDVRSVAETPWKERVAIAMVRREVDDGATVQARWDGGEAAVTVLGNAKGAID